MKNIRLQIQFGHTGKDNERSLTIFTSRNGDVYRDDNFFNILLKNNKNLNIETYPKYYGHLTIVIAWDDIEYYQKYFIYKYNFKNDMISLCNDIKIDNEELLTIAKNLIFLNDSNRQEKIDELCTYLILEKDKLRNNNLHEDYTNIEYCIEFSSKEFLKKYNHIIQAKNFDLI